MVQNNFFLDNEIEEILDSLVKKFPDPRGSGEGERPNDARVAHGLPDGGRVGVATGDHVEDALATSDRRQERKNYVRIANYCCKGIKVA